ncbi:hypothetical protein SAMN02982929_00080 [Saccharopolyspora kobensis]|uniref:Uncharacterized protein n=1 Tax=Saccharopolyspora kobensis TaxID=146035 RepID=A0A1H5T1C5_9PSEU|nr:DUF6361 family protein [Saccharopolyspora kobensis]SEF55968.1 hypothetical protein SAMN02982929_00080 [Saccharopolyspora kobensis]SFC52067.1 hypothetical protein SAMN05216506_101952 [Saccharopolyspora kobensis]
MSSTFGWLDVDDEQRRRMLQVVELFKESGTLDELGIGSVRDAIADLLFPGTSTLHTRLRYLLLVPWAMTEVVDSGRHGDAVARMRRLEIKTIGALLTGSSSRDGIIGRDSKARLKRMPSELYWGALRTYGIVSVDMSAQNWFRQARRVTSDVEDSTGRTRGMIFGLHPDLPGPPQDWLTSCSTELRLAEADFLRDRLQSAVGTSLLGWLAAADQHWDTSGGMIWEHPALASFPSGIRDVVDNARRLSVSFHGAMLLYNLMLAEKLSDEDEASLVDDYRELLDEWEQELSGARVLDGWDHRVLWEIAETSGRRVKPGLRQFFGSWIRILESGGPLAGSAAARELVRARERTLKGSRSRFDNRAALNAWSGESGLGRLSFRWPVASRWLDDLNAAGGR